MSNQLISIILLLPIILITSLIIHQEHLLISLLILEGVILSLIMIIPTTLAYSYITRPQLTIIILTIRVIEARLGLRLLVVISRKHGSDMIKSLTINKC